MRGRKPTPPRPAGPHRAPCRCGCPRVGCRPSKKDYPRMHRYIETCSAHPSTRRLDALLGDVVAVPGVHARFVNTLSRLEYVGVRKMLKSRRSERMDLDGLQHVLDEGVHALRLKKAAIGLGVAAG